MKTWLKSTISVILGVIILVTGSGVSLAKMICLKSGHVEYALTTPEDCCGHEGHKAYSIEAKCCDISSINIDALHYITSSTQSIEKNIVVSEVPSEILYDVYACNAFIGTAVAYCDSDPDLPLPPIRILTKSLLI